MKKLGWGLKDSMWRLTGGDMPWTAKQHLWKSKAKEGYQLSRGGPSNRQKMIQKIASLATLFHVQSTLG